MWWMYLFQDRGPVAIGVTDNHLKDVGTNIFNN